MKTLDYPFIEIIVPDGASEESVFGSEENVFEPWPPPPPKKKVFTFPMRNPFEGCEDEFQDLSGAMLAAYVNREFARYGKAEKFFSYQELADVLSLTDVAMVAHHLQEVGGGNFGITIVRPPTRH